MSWGHVINVMGACHKCHGKHVKNVIPLKIKKRTKFAKIYFLISLFLLLFLLFFLIFFDIDNF